MNALLESRLLLRILIERSHHLRAGMELADIEEHGPRVDRAAPILGPVLDQSFQEQRVRVARVLGSSDLLDLAED